MSTLEDAATGVQAAIDSLDQARTALAAAADELESAVGQFTAVGVTDHVEAASSLKDDVDSLAGSVASLHDTAEEIQGRIIALSGG